MSDIVKKLPKEYYFSGGSLPIALKIVHGNKPSHPHDYTGIAHWHDFSELVIITSGSGIQEINGKCYPVTAGDIFVIMDETVHCFRKYANLEIINIMFTEDLFRGMQEFLNRIPGYNLIFHFEPNFRGNARFRNMLHVDSNALMHIVSVIVKMKREFDTMNSGFEAAVMSMALDLIVFLSRMDESHHKTPHTMTRLAHLLSCLETELCTDWTLQKMAKQTSMSVNNFLRVFRAATGQSPLKYLTRLRMHAACNLLLHSTGNIAEIAFQCGYHDSNYFTKKFTSIFQMSPSAYRKKGIFIQESFPADTNR